MNKPDELDDILEKSGLLGAGILETLRVLTGKPVSYSELHGYARQDEGPWYKMRKRHMPGYYFLRVKRLVDTIERRYPYLLWTVGWISIAYWTGVIVSRKLWRE